MVEQGMAVPLGMRSGWRARQVRRSWQSFPREWAWAVLIFTAVSALRLSTVSLLAKERVKPLGDVLLRWDALHYINIARAGYFETGSGIPANESHTRLAFFPAFPFSMRLTHEVTGLSYFYSGLLVNFIAGTAMVAAVIFLVKHMGASLWGQLGAGVFVAGAPMGLTFNMPYTEAMFAAFSYWALWAMLKRRWFLAGALVFFTCLTRITGVDLLVVFALVVLVYGRTNWRAWLSLGLSPIGMLTYLAFVNAHTRDVGGYFGLQEKGWSSSFDFGKSSLEFLRWSFTGTSDSWVVLVGAFMIFAAFCIVISFGSTPWPVWLFAAGITANILLSGGVVTSRPRLLLPAVICMIPAVVALSRRSLGSAQVAEDAVPDRERAHVRDLAYWGRWLFIAASWTVFGAMISAHPLLATKWAI